MLRGRSLLGSGSLQPAVDDFTRIIATNPGNAEAYHFRAMAHAMLGNEKEAYADRDRARQLDPAYQTAYLYRPTAPIRRRTSSGDADDEPDATSDVATEDGMTPPNEGVLMVGETDNPLSDAALFATPSPSGEMAGPADTGSDKADGRDGNSADAITFTEAILKQSKAHGGEMREAPAGEKQTSGMAKDQPRVPPKNSKQPPQTADDESAARLDETQKPAVSEDSKGSGTASFRFYSAGQRPWSRPISDPRGALRPPLAPGISTGLPSARPTGLQPPVSTGLPSARPPAAAGQTQTGSVDGGANKTFVRIPFPQPVHSTGLNPREN